MRRRPGMRGVRSIGVTSGGRTKDLEDGVRVRRPVHGSGSQLAAARRRELIVLGFAIVLRESPLALDQTALLEPVERDVEGPVFDVNRRVARVLDPARDGVP